MPPQEVCEQAGWVLAIILGLKVRCFTPEGVPGPGQNARGTQPAAEVGPAHLSVLAEGRSGLLHLASSTH